MNFGYLFLLLLQRLLLLLLLVLRMGKHHGSEGRRNLKIAPQKSLT